MEDLVAFLTAEGYRNIVEVPNQGICAVRRMMFTTGLCCNLTAERYDNRYCFHSWAEAVESLREWDGIDHPPGNWIKRKGISPDLLNESYEAL